ncbi:MAG: DNA-directed RNA polymerase subunit omega, partial [Bacillota bacterium]
MRQPSLDILMGKMESKYALVVAAAKRARLLTDGAETLINVTPNEANKPVSIALEEIAAGKINVESP